MRLKLRQVTYITYIFIHSDGILAIANNLFILQN